MRVFINGILCLLGYHTPPEWWTAMNRLSYIVSKSIAEVMYPPDTPPWPSYEDADILREIHDFVKTLIPQKRRLIGCLFAFTEVAPMLRPPFRRFSRIPIHKRLEVLNRWDSGRSYFTNQCAFSIRMLFNLAYLSNENVKKQIGEKSREECTEEIEPRHLTLTHDGAFEGIFEYPALEGKTIREEADFLVIGTGPGGAVVAEELAEAGKSVIVLEQGQFYRPENHTPNAIRILRDVYCEQGLRNTRGNTPVRTFQARALGGSSLINIAICWRPPQWAFDTWKERYGTQEISRETLDPYYDRAERKAFVSPTIEENWGQKGALFKKGLENLGKVGRPNNRAAKGCRGCATCFHGCAIGAKQSMDRSYIPMAIEHGARFYTSCRAEDLIVENGRVAGARGYVLEPVTEKRKGTVEVRAKATVLAAGVFASPVILLKNKLPFRSPAIGRNLSFHNGIAVSGVFNHNVESWIGSTQPWDTEEYLKEGIHLEVLWVNSAMLTARTRGFGDTLRNVMKDLRRTAFWSAAVRGSSRGRVSAGRGWEPNIYFNLNDADVALLKRGMELLVDLFFAAGAVYVRPGVGGVRSEIRTPDEAQELKHTTIKANQFVIGGQHVYGTCSMGPDPGTSVVDSKCAAHGIPDLYICDTGVFPAQTAVNPQLTLMAIAGRLADTLKERY